jgi:hypothetical protein
MLRKVAYRRCRMIGTKVVLAALALFLLAAPAARAAITVDWAGSGDYVTIKEGIAAAGEGDTVLVLDGTYTGPDNRDLDFGGTNIVLVSESGYALTAIYCEGAGRAFHFRGGQDTTSVVRGFTVSGAAADSGAGAFCENGSNVRFIGCLFVNNTAEECGGGLCSIGSSPVIRGCRFEENTADDGASAGWGGGMACLLGSAPVIEDTEFDSNVSRYSGGALYTYYAPITCDGCTFTGNGLVSYGYSGAGASIVFSDGASFAGCVFSRNGINHNPVGGAVYVSSSMLTVSECSFLDNDAGQGAGMHFTEGSGGTVSGCTFAGNTSGWSACGGVSCSFSSAPTITGCTFSDNEYYHVWCDGSSPTIEYSILAFCSPYSPVHCAGETEAPHIHHCFVYGNAGGDSLCGGNFHDIVKLNPLFCDRAEGDYTLCQNSGCLPGVTWPSLVGAHGQGCGPCENAVEAGTWGEIKAMYR